MLTVRVEFHEPGGDRGPLNFCWPPPLPGKHLYQLQDLSALTDTLYLRSNSMTDKLLGVASAVQGSTAHRSFRIRYLNPMHCHAGMMHQLLELLDILPSGLRPDAIWLDPFRMVNSCVEQ